MSIIDNESEPGAWQRELDARPKHPDDERVARALAFLGDAYVFARPQDRLDRRPDPTRPVPEYLRRQDDSQEA